MNKGLFRSVFGLFVLIFSISILILPGVRALTGFDPSLSGSTWSQTPTGTSVSGGNVYNATFSVSEQTYRWAALWGNISGSIVLRTADSSTFMEWTTSQVTDGSVVYATTNDGTLNPSNFASFSNANLQNTDAAYGYDVDVTDSITNTFTGFENFQSPSMNTPIVANTTVLEGAWTNYVFKFNATDVPASSYPGGQDYVVWAVGANASQESFFGIDADYELLIPENQEVGQGAGSPTTYYFWAELN